MEFNANGAATFFIMIIAYFIYSAVSAILKHIRNEREAKRQHELDLKKIELLGQSAYLIDTQAFMNQVDKVIVKAQKEIDKQ